MTLFDRVKETTKMRGWTLAETSKRAGLGQRTIYQWKDKQPSADRLKAVADVLGVSTDYLLGNTDDLHSNNEPKTIDLTTVAKTDSWDDYVSADGRPLSEHDKRVLRAMFGDE